MIAHGALSYRAIAVIGVGLALGSGGLCYYSLRSGRAAFGRTPKTGRVRYYVRSKEPVKYWIVVGLIITMAMTGIFDAIYALVTHQGS